MNNNYDDIINYKYIGSNKHEHMTLYARAAQFQPFAALTGYSDALKESIMIPPKKIILNESEVNAINNKLLIIDNNIKNNNLITITYFNKENNYETITSTIRYIDKVNNFLILANKKKINIADIIDIEI